MGWKRSHRLHARLEEANLTDTPLPWDPKVSNGKSNLDRIRTPHMQSEEAFAMLCTLSPCRKEFNQIVQCGGVLFLFVFFLLLFGLC